MLSNSVDEPEAARVAAPGYPRAYSGPHPMVCLHASQLTAASLSVTWSYDLCYERVPTKELDRCGVNFYVREKDVRASPTLKSTLIPLEEITLLRCCMAVDFFPSTS
jgi:hypothetical protein